jgi:mannose/fructose/N-acetylgalactosamine-specific phosphotransferase system component IIC
MLDSVLGFLSPIFAFLVAKYGIIGSIIAYGIAIAPIVTVLIQLLEFIFSFLANQQDEAVAQQIDAVWQKILPWLELLPHANLPILPFLKYIINGANALKGAVQGWLSSSNPPSPPSPPAPPSNPSLPSS